MASRGSSRGGYFRGGPPRGGPSRGGPSRGGPPRGGFRGGGRGGSVVQMYNPSGGPTQPDRNIIDLENKIVAGFKNLAPEIHNGDFPPRRGFGTTGENTLVRANYFPLSFKPGTVFYRYRIKISPDERKKAIRRRIITLFMEEALKKERTDPIVTDGGDLIFAIEELPLQDLNLAQDQDFKVKLWWDDDALKGPHDRSKEFLVQIQRIASITATKLTQEYVMGQSRHRQNGDQESTIPLDIIQIINTVLNHEPQINTKTVGAGKNKFFHLPSEGGVSADLGGGLEAIQGFYKSVRPTFGRVMCNINVVASPFYKDIPLIEIMGLFLGRSIDNGPLDNDERRRLSTFLGRIKVKMTHIQGKPTFIGKISPQSSTEYKFRCEQLGREITVKDYFYNKYRRRLSFEKLQLIQSGNTMLPAEVCSVCPGQLFRGRISEAQTSNMIQFACRDPTANARLIVSSGLKVLNLENDKDSIPFKFGVKVEPHMAVVPARILPPPTIHYQQKKADFETGRGSWNLRAQKFFKGCTIKRLLVVTFKHTRDRAYTDQNIDILVDQFKESCRELGVGIGQHHRFERVGGNRPNELLDPLFKSWYEDPDREPGLVLCILPDNLKHIFNEIKYLGDTKYGFPTVVMLFSKVSRGIERGNKQYWANLLLKINMRLGGINHTLKSEALKPLLPPEGPAMLVGMDVTHPSPGSPKGSLSITSMVASCDEHFMNYPCSLRIQSQGEMVSDIVEMLTERLQQYKKSMPNVRDGRPPKIIVYRDGVSEGEFGRVLDLEFPKIVHACALWDKNYRPKITFIIVGKRHHTRFYPMEESKADEKKNCLPGTVVDRGVTAVYDWDFFLQAHKGLQGTTRPAHYYVLKDENGFTADSLQCLTMNLCHLFARCTKAVSVCPPAKFADIACERGRVYLAHGMDRPAADTNDENTPQAVERKAREAWDRGVHPNLRNTMFYL